MAQRAAPDGAVTPDRTRADEDQIERVRVAALWLLPASRHHCIGGNRKRSHWAQRDAEPSSPHHLRASGLGAAVSVTASLSPIVCPSLQFFVEG